MCCDIMCDWKNGLTREEIQGTEQGMTKLRTMIDQFESYGTPFEKICNNDTIKYDVLGKGFYVFKHLYKGRTQLRILYQFIRNEDQTFELKVHRVYCKRKSNSATQALYLKQFKHYIDSILS